MIVYGTKIKSDIELSLDLSQETETRYEVELSSKIPSSLKESITCGFPLYWAHGRKVYLYSDRLFSKSEAKQPWCYEVKNVVKFYWVGGERSIYYELYENENSERLGFWFIHLLMPLYMTLEEMYNLLHAGAVEVEEKPILFIAPSMGGKSTMTDYFIKQGHPLVSDDKVPTFIQDGKFMAVGSHPYHRPYRKFEELGYRVEKFTDRFKPIHAFYALEGVDRNEEISINEIIGFAKFDALLPNYLYTFSWLKPQRLGYLSQMLNGIRVFHVKVPWDLERLDAVYGAICRHSKEGV
jgi:hypothetical protein